MRKSWRPSVTVNDRFSNWGCWYIFYGHTNSCFSQLSHNYSSFHLSQWLSLWRKIVCDIASLIPVFTATTINHLPTLWSSPLARDNWRWQFHGLLLGLWLVSAGHVTPILASDWLRTVVTRSRVWDATLVIIVIIIVGGGGCWFCGHTMGPINTNNQTHLGHWDTPPFYYKSQPVPIYGGKIKKM